MTTTTKKCSWYLHVQANRPNGRRVGASVRKGRCTSPIALMQCPQAATAVAAVIAVGHWRHREIQFAMPTQKYRGRGWECRGHLEPERKRGEDRWLWRSLPAMGTVRWRYTSTVPWPLFVDAMQEVLDRRGWRALADAELATRYLD